MRNTVDRSLILWMYRAGLAYKGIAAVYLAIHNREIGVSQINRYISMLRESYEVEPASITYDEAKRGYERERFGAEEHEPLNWPGDPLMRHEQESGQSSRIPDATLSNRVVLRPVPISSDVMTGERPARKARNLNRVEEEHVRIANEGLQRNERLKSELDAVVLALRDKQRQIAEAGITLDLRVLGRLEFLYDRANSLIAKIAAIDSQYINVRNQSYGFNEPEANAEAAPKIQQLVINIMSNDRGASPGPLSVQGSEIVEGQILCSDHSWGTEHPVLEADSEDA